MNRITLIKQLTLLLGGSLVGVELTDDHYNLAIDRAILRYKYRSSNATTDVFIGIQALPEVITYKLPDNIVEVIKITRQGIGLMSTAPSVDPVNLAIAQQLLAVGRSGGLFTFYLFSSYQQLMRKLFATEITFNYNKHTKEITLYKSIKQTETLLLHAVEEKTEEVLLNDTRAFQWISEYSLAVSKMMLGEARSKFSAISAPGNSSLNGEALKTEAKESIEKLELEITNYMDQEEGLSLIMG